VFSSDLLSTGQLMYEVATWYNVYLHKMALDVHEIDNASVRIATFLVFLPWSPTKYQLLQFDLLTFRIAYHSLLNTVLHNACST